MAERNLHHLTGHDPKQQPPRHPEVHSIKPKLSESSSLIAP